MAALDDLKTIVTAVVARAAKAETDLAQAQANLRAEEADHNQTKIQLAAAVQANNSVNSELEALKAQLAPLAGA